MHTVFHHHYGRKRMETRELKERALEQDITSKYCQKSSMKTTEEPSNTIYKKNLQLTCLCFNELLNREITS